MTSATSPPPADSEPGTSPAAARAAAAGDRAEAEVHRDLAADDRDVASEGRDTAEVHRDAAEVGRDLAADERVATSASRQKQPSLRDAAADRRDAAADRRDAVADRRDTVAAARDSVAADRDSVAEDRDSVAEDRETTAADRDTVAGTDELTGALRRRAGFLALQHEIDRCRREDLSLIVAFVDVDAMKKVNDTRGHQAGDELLRDVVKHLQASLRSYDVLMRFGGDEFLYSLAGAELNEAADRFDKMSASLGRARGDSVSAGFAQLGPGDTLYALIGRADADLYERRKARGHGEAELR